VASGWMQLDGRKVFYREQILTAKGMTGHQFEVYMVHGGMLVDIGITAEQGRHAGPISAFKRSLKSVKWLD